jgi:hypothetical protein
VSTQAMIQIFFDETGEFRPAAPGKLELAAVLALIVPSVDSDSLEKDFLKFVSTLPASAFAKGEPKGSRLPLDRLKSLASMLNMHPGIMTVPTTFNREIESPSFRTWPEQLKAILEKQAALCVHDTMRREVETLAKRCGNLSSEQISRLLTYKIAVERALSGVCLFYHCRKYHSSYSPIKIIFDRTGAANSREELVFQEMIFIWVTNNTFDSITQIHTDDHPFVQLYGTRVNGRRAFDVAKIIRGNFEFRDSKTTWQLQLTDMLASAWIKTVKDRSNEVGYLPLFRLLHRNSTLSNAQPLQMMSLAEHPEEKFAPADFNVFVRLARKQGKVLPCRWDET